MDRQSLYQNDLAYIHHVGFGRFSLQAAPELLQILRRRGIEGGTLVDLGCGNGLWAGAAGRAGFTVIGVDRSPAMIRLARGVAPSARFHCASLHDFELPPCEAVTAIGEGLNYLWPDESGVRPLARLFRRVARVLRPGGLFIGDVMLSEGKPINHRDWRSGKDWVVLTEVVEQPAQRLLVRRIITFRKIGAKWRRGEEIHRIRLFGRAEIQQALLDAGFSVRLARRYGAMTLLRRRMSFVARKPR